MFEWNVKEAILLKTKEEVMYDHYSIEDEVSIEYKLEFVDNIMGKNYQN